MMDKLDAQLIIIFKIYFQNLDLQMTAGINGFMWFPRHGGNTLSDLQTNLHKGSLTLNVVLTVIVLEYLSQCMLCAIYITTSLLINFIICFKLCSHGK